VVFLNLRILGAGFDYPQEELWRVEVAALIVIFLALLSVEVWGRILRGLVIALLVIAASTIIIPFLGQYVAEPTTYFYMDQAYTPRQVNFIAEQGDELTFTIDPMTSPDDFKVETLRGYVENDNQLANTTWDAFNTTAGLVNGNQYDPTNYDLSLAVQVWGWQEDQSSVIAQSDFSQGTTEPTKFTWKAPSSGWYTFTLVSDEQNPGDNGAAWLKVDNLEIFYSTIPATRAREEKYGKPPTLDCTNCGTSANRTDMRYQGSRTIPQFFSLQVAPFLLFIRRFFFLALIIGTAGYWLGKAAKSMSLPVSPTMRTSETTLLTIALICFIGYVGIQIAGAINETQVLTDLNLVVISAFILTMLVYALVQFVKPDKSHLTRGITLLWLLALPIILRIINGFDTSTLLPKVNSSLYGGILVTLLLAAVSITLSLPIGVLLALGRQSSLPIISLLCSVFIEIIRGVPLITLIFMGRYIVPFFAAGLQDMDLLIRMIVVMTLFSSAYLAEIVRGGLQIIPKGQLEASHALGLSELWVTILIVLPQAMRAVIPAIMGQAVSLFKDTSLVAIIGLYELTGSMQIILRDSQTGYTAFPREGFLYIGILYFVVSYIMAEVSRRLERTGSGIVRKDRL
jgi:general L-amino acid transport system permease protein